MQLSNFIVAAGLLDWVNDTVSEVDSTIKVILGVVGVIVGVSIIVKNPSIGRVIMGSVVGAFIVSLPWLIPAVGNMFRGDIG